MSSHLESTPLLTSTLRSSIASTANTPLYNAVNLLPSNPLNAIISGTFSNLDTLPHHSGKLSPPPPPLLSPPRPTLPPPPGSPTTSLPSFQSSSSSLGAKVTISPADLALSIAPFKAILTQSLLFSFLSFLLSLLPPTGPLLLLDLLLHLIHLRSILHSLPHLEAFFAKVRPGSKSHYIRNIATSLPTLISLTTLKLSQVVLTLLLSLSSPTPLFHYTLSTYTLFFTLHASLILQFTLPLTPLILPLSLPPLLLRLQTLLPPTTFEHTLVAILLLTLTIHYATTVTKTLPTVLKHPTTHALLLAYVGKDEDCDTAVAATALQSLYLAYLALVGCYYLHQLLTTTRSSSPSSTSVAVLPHHKPLMAAFICLSLLLVAYLTFYSPSLKEFRLVTISVLYVAMLLAGRLNYTYIKSRTSRIVDIRRWLGNHRIVPFVAVDELVWREGVGWGGRTGGGRMWIEGIGWGIKG